MKPYSPFTALALALLLVAAITETAYADRFTVTITSGTLSYPVQNSASLRVQFPDGSASIGWDDGLGGDWVPDFYPACCAPGNQLSLSADESFPNPDGFHFGEFLFGSEIYSVSHFTFAVVALRDIDIPSIADGERRTFTGIPFSFTGTLVGSSSNQQTIMLDLIGSGHASATIFGLSPPPASYLGWASYDFETTAPSPVPEPGTLVLFATGIGIGLGRMRRNLAGWRGPTYHTDNLESALSAGDSGPDI